MYENIKTLKSVKRGRAPGKDRVSIDLSKVTREITGENFKSYRAISLLQIVYNLFLKVIMNRIPDTLVSNQFPKQVGFQSGFSTLDHTLQTVNQLTENR